MLQKYNLPLEIDDIQDDSESEAMNVPVADSIEESQFDQFLRQQEFNTDNAECMCAIEPCLDPPATPVYWPEDGILTREWITKTSVQFLIGLHAT